MSFILGKPKGYTKKPIELDIYAIKENNEKIKLGILRPCYIEDINRNVSIKDNQYEYPYYRIIDEYEWYLEFNKRIEMYYGKE